MKSILSAALGKNLNNVTFLRSLSFSLSSSSSSFNFNLSSCGFSTKSKGSKKKALRVVLVGPPGSGKGTQTKSIQQDFQLKTFVTGDLLRDFAKLNTPTAINVRTAMNQGSFVDDEIILNLLKSQFEAETDGNGWLLDGFPRNAKQAHYLHNMLTTQFDKNQTKENQNQQLTHVFYLNVPEEEVVKRIQGRLIHKASGRLYHVTYNAPKRPGLDDVTGEALEKRDDDDIQHVLSRMRDYHLKTKPLIQFYTDFGILHNISSPTSKDGYVVIKDILTKSAV